MTQTAGAPSSDADLALAGRAVDRGWLTREQVEAAVLARDRAPATRLFDHLPLTAEQLRALGAAARVPPEVAEAMKDPANRVGRYWRTSRLGSGGMGLVFRGWDEPLGRWVALKFLKQIGDEQARAYFRREAHLAASLEHPNIAKIYEVGEEEGQPYIAMQYVDGTTHSGAKLKLEEMLEAVKRIAEAVGYAHGKNVIHRDLKPANVMMDGAKRVFVMDFGLAKETHVDGESLTGTNVVVGTPNYMAPEQARARATAQSDVYSIGAILYELTTGRPPFVGETTADVLTQVVAAEPVWPRKLSPAIPPDLEAIVLKALEKDAKRRYGSAGDLLEDLGAFAQHEPLKHAKRPTTAYVLGKKIRKQPLLWGSTTALILAIAGGAVFGTTQLLRARREALKAQHEAEEKTRVEREERAKTEEALRRAEERRVEAVEAKRRADERLSYSLILRARQSDEASAAVLLAEAYATDPSPLAGASAAAALRVPTLRMALGKLNTLHGNVRLSPDGRFLAVVPDRPFGEEAYCEIWDVETRKRRGALRGHPEFLRSVVFSRDGKRLASVAAGKTVRLWDVETMSAVGGTIATKDEVVRGVFTNDDREFWSWSWNGTVQRWDAATGESLGAAIRGRGYPDRILVDPGGTRAAIGGSDTSAYLWDLTGAKLVEKPLAHSGSTRAIAFSPDGRRVATGSIDGTAAVWKSATGDSLLSIRAASGVFGVEDVAFSPDGRLLATADADGTARLWNSETGDPVGEPMRHEKAVLCAAFDPEGRRLLTGGTDGKIRFWTVPEGRFAERMLHGEGAVGWMRFTPDGRRLAAASGTSVRVWDLDVDLGWRVPPDQGYSRAVFLPDGRRILAGGWRNTRLWDAERRVPLGPERPVEPPGQIVALLPGGKTCLSEHSLRQSADGLDLRLWDMESGRQVGETMHVDYWFLKSVDFSPDGLRIATALEKKVWIWDATTGRLVAGPILHKEWVGGAAFGLDGRELLTVSHGRPVHRWDARTGERIGEAGDRGASDLAAFSPDRRRVATVWTGTARIVDAGTGATVGDPIEHAANIKVLLFSPDGTRLLTAGQDHAIRIHDARTGARLGRTLRHANWVNCAAFSPDGRWLATGGNDDVVRLWDAERFEPVCAPLPCDGHVWTVEFGRDGRRVLSVAGEKGAVQCWDVAWLVDRPSAEEVRKAARARTGLRLDARGEIEVLSAEEWTLQNPPAEK
ncbi:MAG: protein kinase [Planctomycetes bacterium]|nr:protein kinase [Planctomycetota bacterium]